MNIEFNFVDLNNNIVADTECKVGMIAYFTCFSRKGNLIP